MWTAFLVDLRHKHRRLGLVRFVIGLHGGLHPWSVYSVESRMTHIQAIAILERVKAGDKTPTLAEITEALVVTGDLDA
jgi:hypothetical protein